MPRSQSHNTVLNAWGEPVPSVTASEYMEENDLEYYEQMDEYCDVYDGSSSSSPAVGAPAPEHISTQPTSPGFITTRSTHVVSDMLNTLPLHQLDSFARFRPGAIVSSALFSLQYQRMKLAASVKYMEYQQGRVSVGRPHPLRQTENY